MTKKELEKRLLKNNMDELKKLLEQEDLSNLSEQIEKLDQTTMYAYLIALPNLK